MDTGGSQQTTARATV